MVDEFEELEVEVPVNTNPEPVYNTEIDYLESAYYYNEDYGF